MPADQPPGDRSPDEQPDVRFVVSGSAAGEFEELPAGDRPAPRRRMLILAAAVVIGFGLIAAGIARVATSTSHPTGRRATVTVTPSTSDIAPSAASTGPTIAVQGPSLGELPIVAPGELSFLAELTNAEIASAHAECPRVARSCTTTGEVPTEVRGALRARFPGAREFVAVSDIVSTDTSAPRLAYRRVSALTRHLHITVEVRPAGPADHDGGISIITAGTASVRVQRVVGSFTVEAQVTSPHARAPDASGLSALLADHRLLATG